MKKIQQLRKYWEILIGIYSAYTVISTLLLLVALVSNDQPNINSLINGKKITIINNSVRVIVVLMATGNILYIIVLVKIQKLISLFMNNVSFTIYSIKLLKEIGSYLIISTLLICFPSFIYNSTINFESTNGVFTQSLSNTAFIFFILLGGFFVILSHIFEEAKAIKEENELTI